MKVIVLVFLRFSKYCYIYNFKFLLDITKKIHLCDLLTHETFWHWRKHNKTINDQP
jgi:hypothetical protein